MPKTSEKRITDPIHGTISLTAPEVSIISTRTFQRLHNVKQLGLAHYVFPGANYSRFAHSIGACHIAGQMLNTIQVASPERLTDEELQLHRIAALLHDIGHYPFSHLTEHAVRDFFKAKALLTTSGEQSGAALTAQEAEPEEPPAYDHEILGRRLLDHDQELTDALQKHGIDPAKVKDVFSSQTPRVIKNIISSDLDCDRLDYLIRTAHHAGLPYGRVDLDYICKQVRLDSQGHFCLGPRALRSVDHLLMARYFDYSQVAFHKTVVGLEQTMSDVIHALLHRELLPLSSNDLLNSIKSNKFHQLTDDVFMERIKKLYESLGESPDELPIKIKIESVLYRRPPKLVGNIEVLRPADNASDYRTWIHEFQKVIPKLSDKYDLHKDLWQIWYRPLSLTKITPYVPVSAISAGGFDEDEAEDSIRILKNVSDDKEERSTLLFDCENSLMRILSNYRMYAVRVFVHLPKDSVGKRQSISSALKEEFPHFPWV